MRRFSRASLAVAVTTASLVFASAGSAQSPVPAGSKAPPPNPCAGIHPHSGPTHVFPTNPAEWKIGVATDVGSVDDKNFNEYTYLGAKNAAAALGAAVPPAVVPKDASEYGKNIQGFIDDGYDIIVTQGFNFSQVTTCAAHANPDIWFVGIDEGGGNLCVAPDGSYDSTFACKGDSAVLNPRYVAISFQEDQPGYLAGMVAASVSQNGVIGAVGGITLCGPCIRYIQGYELGAKSINPQIDVKVAWVTESDFGKAFYDHQGGVLFGENFINLEQPDVVFQVAGQTGNGVLDAACGASIWGIGVDVDQFGSYPDAASCILTSAEKKLTRATEEDIKAIVGGTIKGGDDHWNAARDGVGVSSFHDHADKVPSDMQQKLDDAFAQMKAGTLKTCPSKADGDPVDCGFLK